MKCGYIIEYSIFKFTFKLEEIDREERMKGFCSAATLSKMLTCGQYDVWCAHLVNPDLSDLSEYKTIHL